MPREFSFETWSFMSEISRTTTKTTTLLFSKKRTQSSSYWIQSQVRSRLVAPNNLCIHVHENSDWSKSSKPFFFSFKSFVQRVLNKQDEGLFWKSTYTSYVFKQTKNLELNFYSKAVNSYKTPTQLSLQLQKMLFFKIKQNLRFYQQLFNLVLRVLSPLGTRLKTVLSQNDDVNLQNSKFYGVIHWLSTSTSYSVCF